MSLLRSKTFLKVLNTFHITSPQALRVYRAGLPIDEAEHVWICLHGYGQLAQFFQRKFQVLEDQAHLVFPEAMHRFYLEGSSGRVGASWMTKENREVDIANQAAYLDRVVEALRLKPGVKLTVLGFSQGAATASRWAVRPETRVDNLILWSSVWPPDLAWENHLTIDQLPSIHYVLGRVDPYLSSLFEDGIIKELPMMERATRPLYFDGGHEIRPAELLEIFARITR